jgi:hypothetical protein
VSSSETLEAIAVKTSYTTSAAAAAAYTINLPQAAMPMLSPAGGTYSSAQSVTISTTTPGATIYYTTNGTTPTTSSSVYSAPITISSSETLEAIAVETGYTTSAAVTAAYTMAPVLPAPTFLPAAGTYTTSQSVTTSDATAGTTIYYTTNGTTPTTASSLYSGPITVSSSETLEAIAVKTSYTTSAAAAAAYTINSGGSIVTSGPLSITVNPASLAVTDGQSATASVLVTSQIPFTSPLSFNCSGLPSGASCSFSPGTMTPSGETASTTLTINTSMTTAALRRETTPMFPGSMLALTLCLIGWKKRRGFTLLLALVAFGLSVCTGCNMPLAKFQATTQPTVSMVTVSAQAGSQPLITTTLNLTVQ